jgi:cytochrome c553
MNGGQVLIGMRKVFLSFIVMLCFPLSAFADPSAARGAALVNACATCHGPDGRSQGAIPSINSLSKENFVAAMRAFQTGERQGTVMNRIAKGLDETDIEAVAAYLAAKPQE